MSIESLIATGIQPVQIPSPLAQASQLAQLRNSMNQNELARYTLGKAQQEDVTRNALADAYRQSVNEAGDIDYPALTRRLAAGGAGSQIAGILKTKFEGEEAANKANKAQVDLLDAALKQSRGFLATINPNSPTAPQQFLTWHHSQHAHKVIGPELARRGITPEQSLERINEAIAGGPAAFAQLLQQSALGIEKFMELNKPTTTVVDRSGQRDVLQTPGLGGRPTTVGTYPDVPFPENVEAQKMRMRPPGTTVNVSTDKAYGGAVAASAGKSDLAQVEAAAALPQQFAKVNETLQLLRTGDLNTGIGAELFTVLDRAKTQFANDKKAGQRVENTQYLDALLGSEVFPLIQQLGIGARGLDTPAEREYLRKVMTGTINLDRSTLLRLTELRRQALVNKAKEFNERVGSGELDALYKALPGRVKRKVDIPPEGAPDAGTSPVRAKADEILRGGK